MKSSFDDGTDYFTGSKRIRSSTRKLLHGSGVPARNICDVFPGETRIKIQTLCGQTSAAGTKHHAELAQRFIMFKKERWEALGGSFALKVQYWRICLLQTSFLHWRSILKADTHQLKPLVRECKTLAATRRLLLAPSITSSLLIAVLCSKRSAGRLWMVAFPLRLCIQASFYFKEIFLRVYLITRAVSQR